MKLVITNNPLVKQATACQYLEGKDYLDVLLTARDHIHRGYLLLTHPLSSNFLADKTFYKTLVLEEHQDLDLRSIEIIENAIILVRDSLKRRDPRIYDEGIKQDLQFIDYEIIKDTWK